MKLSLHILKTWFQDMHISLKSSISSDSCELITFCISNEKQPSTIGQICPGNTFDPQLPSDVCAIIDGEDYLLLKKYPVNKLMSFH
ncbi:hypothetical protein P261_01541 [Lachnospiraceae bacterium TWA4]|nr:hypothetical protein P261_01541 [Lachnospiraceae bacterium TWA4]